MTRQIAITKIEELLVKFADAPATVANLTSRRDHLVAITDAEYEAEIAAARAAGQIK